MPSARNSYTVRSIGEALEKANEYPENIGFLVAPLSTKTGGARKWFGLNPDNHRQWMAESDSTDEKEPLPPSTDAGVENLGPLPPSKIGMWELVFLNKNGEPMRPRVLIDSSTASVGSDEEPESIPAASSASTGGSTVDPVVATMLAQHHKFALECLKASKEMMLTVSEQQKKFTAQLQESLDKANERAAESDKVRDMALGANTELHHKLAELESDNVVATTVQKVFDGKPELLITAGRELFKGVVEALRGTAAAPAAGAANAAAGAANAAAGAAA